MAPGDEEEQLLRSVALQNAQSILAARQRAEQEIQHAKEALEAKTAELARSLAMMRATLESTTDGILVVDRADTVTDFNEQFLRLWRLPREALAPRDYRVVSELVAQSTEDAELRQGLATIARNAHAQVKLIEDLLDMNRIISGKIRLDVQRADLTAIVDAAVEAVRPSAEAKGVRLRKIIDPTAGPVSGDPNRLQQVVWNLLSNAVKFTPKGGKVDVLLERVNSHLEVAVHDSGMGIDASFLPHVFERFRQADATITRTAGGLGLGLAIAKQLVELHGGTIRVESPGEGQGSTFVVSLPLQALRETPDRQHPSGVRVRAAGQSDIDLSGIKVLVIDDEPDARELVKRVLSRSKALVFSAATADAGFELLQSERSDVLISDIGMPGKDGYQLMREIRALPESRGGRISAIALTAFARSEDRTKAMLAGYQVHLAKPIEPRELVAAVRSLAGRTDGGDQRRG